MSTASYQQQIESILAEELAPKKAKELAAKIAELAPPAAPSPAMDPTTALGVLARALGIGGKAITTPPAAAKAAPKTPPGKKAAAASKATPVKAAAKPSKAKVAAKPKVKATGKRKLPDESRSKMGAKKLVYWALYRQLKKEPAQEGDETAIAAAEPELVKAYTTKVKERLKKGKPTEQAKPTKSPVKVAAKPAAKAASKPNKSAAKAKTASKSGAKTAKAATKAESKPPKVEPAKLGAAKPAPNGTANGTPPPGLSEEQQKALGL